MTCECNDKQTNKGLTAKVQVNLSGLRSQVHDLLALLHHLKATELRSRGGNDD